jgi:hypothetical protein
MDAQDLADWRRRLGLTQKQAAEVLGITLRGYQKREAGATPIDREAELACRDLAENPDVAEAAKRNGPFLALYAERTLADGIILRQAERAGLLEALRFLADARVALGPSFFAPGIHENDGTEYRSVLSEARILSYLSNSVGSRG